MSEHHPSCTPNDRDLVWLCAQCGGHEDATEVEQMLDEAIKIIMHEWGYTRIQTVEWLKRKVIGED